jgi:calpain-7
MKRHVGRDTPKNDDSEAAKMKRLMVDKIEYYEMHAQELMRQVKEYKKQAGNSLVNDDLGFVLQRNGSPNSSWEDKHASQLQSTRDNSMPSSKVVKDHVDNSKSTNEAAVQAAGKASVSLSSAIKFDESKEMSSAIEQYLASAQHYLEAVKILCQENEVTNSELIASLKRKVQVALDRVQELKKKQAGNKPKPDCDEIRKKLASLEPTTHKVSHTKPNCDEINRKLEQLATLEPTNNASLTPYEIEVLRKSSTLTSGLFLPWCDEEARTYNYFSHISPWTDPDGLLTLSDKQKERFYKWARPSQIVSMKRHPSRDNIAMIHSITPFTIKQYCVSDCSFVAGLCIAAAYERRFKKPILSSLIYPQDSSGKPIYNPHGVYMVKLWLNGVARRVLVDDLLPIDKKGKLLCSHTDGRLSRSQRNLLERGTPLELWVSILEKAYMKLCGGYDFPGSNSGIDLFSLTVRTFVVDVVVLQVKVFECKNVTTLSTYINLTL